MPTIAARSGNDNALNENKSFVGAMYTIATETIMTTANARANGRESFGACQKCLRPRTDGIIAKPNKVRYTYKLVCETANGRFFTRAKKNTSNNAVKLPRNNEIKMSERPLYLLGRASSSVPTLSVAMATKGTSPSKFVSNNCMVSKGKLAEIKYNPLKAKKFPKFPIIV